MTYKVNYIDNTGPEDFIQEYATEQEANDAINEDVENVIKYMECWYYADFGTYVAVYSRTTNEYAEWHRLWRE